MEVEANGGRSEWRSKRCVMATALLEGGRRRRGVPVAALFSELFLCCVEGVSRGDPAGLKAQFHCNFIENQLKIDGESIENR